MKAPELTSAAKRTDLSREALPFLVSAGIWLVLGSFVCATQAEPAIRGRVMVWFFGFWALALLDLVALTQTILAAAKLMDATPENRAPTAIQALYWGILKLACIGIFGAILIKASDIPSSGLLLGLGTLVFVPVVGGLWWSQRALRHA